MSEGKIQNVFVDDDDGGGREILNSDFKCVKGGEKRAGDRGKNRRGAMQRHTKTPRP